MTVTEGETLWDVLDERFDLDAALGDDRRELVHLRISPPEETDPGRTVARYSITLEHPVYRSEGNMELPGVDEEGEMTRSEYDGRISRYDDRWALTDGEPRGTFFGPDSGYGAL